MCGFAGVVVWDEKFRVSRETLEKMSARVAHRGPDGQGLYLSPDCQISPDHPQVGLVHRRLAILDLDPRANQPFTDNHGRWIVFNGEIYNFRELRAELSSLRPDYAWRTTGDTEVLLVAYGQWGAKCVDYLNGMFAFAVWDGPNASLFLARDRMGQKPLYVTSPQSGPDARAVAFASELHALRAIPWLSTEISAEALAEYLRWGCIGDEATIYRGAQKLDAGMWRTIRASEQSRECYFRPNEVSGRAADAVSRTRELVSRAVARQLVSDVPVGCFLSGGIDSSVIAAAACGQQPLVAYSIGFDDSRYDETPFAIKVAEHLKLHHERFTVRPDAAADLPKLAEVYGEPFGDSSALPTHYLARETRRHVKVALSGDGGDELFGGYDRYRAMRLDRRIRKLPRPVRAALVTHTSGRLSGRHPKSAASRLGRFLRTIDQSPARRYSSYLRIFDDPCITDLVCDKAEFCPDDVETNFERLSIDRDAVEAALATDRIAYLPNDLLTKLDRASMLHALEVRSPFMDHELVQFAAGLSADQLLKGGPKRMLREAFARDLPAWVFKRRKMGFAVPIGEWFRGELRPMLRDSLFAADSFAGLHFNRKIVERLVDEHERQRVDHSQRLYALLMLELWWRISRAG